ncbi:hypothetical protein VULLAG_LOCUS1745 [Vulpes lagopus]
MRAPGAGGGGEGKGGGGAGGRSGAFFWSESRAQEESFAVIGDMTITLIPQIKEKNSETDGQPYRRIR